RGGGRFVVDRNVFVDISSYGRQGIDALTRALGIDVIVLGSDRPYAKPSDLYLGDAARYAVCVANPHRLLEGGTA
ncbi:MAG: amidohydrolase, partial [Jatrophihabitans sp.]|nr:amidohydrolase [Jatrophihabitans sp.]